AEGDLAVVGGPQPRVLCPVALVVGAAEAVGEGAQQGEPDLAVGAVGGDLDAAGDGPAGAHLGDIGQVDQTALQRLDEDVVVVVGAVDHCHQVCKPQHAAGTAGLPGHVIIVPALVIGILNAGQLHHPAVG